MTLALVDRQGGFVRIRAPGDDLSAPSAGCVWLPVRDQMPSFDHFTQDLTGPEIIVMADAVVRRWAVRDKTADEIAAQIEDAKNSQIDRLGKLVLGTMLDMENRIRRLEGEASLTPAQFRDQIKRRLP